MGLFYDAMMGEISIYWTVAATISATLKGENSNSYVTLAEANINILLFSEFNLVTLSL